MATKKYPIKKPILLNKEDIALPFDISKYFGIVMCEVEPPKKLFLPVLPYKTKDQKLMFPLCRYCAEEKIQKCTHFGQQCRNLIGCYTTVELELAISEGYKVITVHQIYHFEESSSNLFQGFVKEMLRGKIEASGYPSTVTTEAEKVKFQQDIVYVDDIKLDPKNIKYNPSSRCLHKNLLTNLWGKFGQSPAKRKQMDFIKTSEKLMELNDKILNHKVILNNVYALSENKLLVDFTPTSYHMPVPFSSNPILASFVTAYGRLELYKHMKIIGKKPCIY